MKIYIGVFLSTFILFFLGVLGNKLFLYFGYDFYGIQNSSEKILSGYVLYFINNLIVISLLTWMITKVMPLLDKPRKRVLFIFILGIIFSLYSRSAILLSGQPWINLYLGLAFDALVWFILSIILAQFIKPKHLGAS
ncbi:MAG: hypothetical protein P8J93_03905 [SAR86 cluster bacterium]|nr:hypothetical protein [SAR86 cluster bacterium]